MTNLLVVCDSEVIEGMARQLLAGLEQEPMAWVTMQKEFCDDERTAITNRVDADRYSISCYDLTPLYAAPQLPHPAVPDEIDVNDPALDTHRKWMAEGWNRCRAAMLQAGNSPAAQDGWIPVSERMPEGMTDVHISNGHDVGQGWWDGDTWQTQHDYYSVPGDVTHWMPLPAAPQQEVKNV
ncbi:MULTISPECIES: DUF551 domain-containing protein [Citrobacter freundii complex]|uniref:DUF551 domain-containing protein n=1 Tax=Citrobacter freundii complex TaxID=1344959 RepID=UPI0023B2DFFD|nr:DUF551 domain-containing protein [Citrobacter freundii]MDE9640052.1 DUF551 domain-containing protein [Citrobacter freundii]